MFKLRSTFFPILAGIALASCQTATPNLPSLKPAAKPVPAAAAPDLVSGQWIPTDEASKGIYVATFKDGNFISKSPKDGKILAKGSYTQQAEKLMLKFVGAATGTVVNASCERKSPTALYCVPSVGSPFNLAKSV